MNEDEQNYGLYYRKAVTIKNCDSVFLISLTIFSINGYDKLLLINSKRENLIKDISCQDIAMVYNSTKPSDASIKLKRYSVVGTVMEHSYTILLVLRGYFAAVNIRISDALFVSYNNLLVLHVRFLEYGSKE